MSIEVSRMYSLLQIILGGCSFDNDYAALKPQMRCILWYIYVADTIQFPA